jgi:hypothetical protein
VVEDVESEEKTNKKKKVKVIKVVAAAKNNEEEKMEEERNVSSGPTTVVERARRLFDMRESMVDHCVSGNDAEDVLTELGATAIANTVPVRHLFF